MTSHALEDEHDQALPVLKPPQETGLPEKGPVVSPPSMEAPRLGTGPLPEAIPKPTVKDDVKEGGPRGESSAEKLATLAQPKVFPGPEVDLQKGIVTKLETSIPEIDKAAAAKEREAQTVYQEWRDNWVREHPTPSKQDQDAFKKEQKVRQRMIPPSKYDDSDNMYIGSIVLTGIPPTKEGEAELIRDARLIYTDHSLSMNTNAIDLPKLAGVEQDVVTNTLRTMSEAGQLDYLRKAGFVGRGWKIIVEVHYYRRRSKQQANLHKDTLGETLFVNLNYTNDKPMPGPEWVVNPPTAAVHEDHIAHSLPAQFNADLAEVRRQSKDPKEIETQTLPPNAVVSFVDEAIHHATPLMGHRPVAASGLKKFLAEDADYKTDYADAVAAYAKAFPGGIWDYVPGKPLYFYFTSKTVTVWESTRWKALITLSKKSDTDPLTRPQLKKAGMTPEQIDRLVSGYGTTMFNAASIPGDGRTDGSSSRLPMTKPGEERPTTLKRRMSQLALDKKMPVDPGGDRRFFRTWVRAVKVEG